MLLSSTVYVDPDECVWSSGYAFSRRLNLQPFLDAVGVKAKAHRHRAFGRDSPMANAFEECRARGLDLMLHAHSKLNLRSRYTILYYGIGGWGLR